MTSRKSRAFYVETLIITFLLLYMLTILIRVYGAAAEHSQSAERRTKAANIMQNITVLFAEGEEPFGAAQQKLLKEARDGDGFTIPTDMVEMHFNEDGLPDEEGKYLAQVSLSCENRPVGFMVAASAFVYYNNDIENLLSSIDTAKYFPDDESGYVLSGDLDLDLAEMETEAETEAEDTFSAETEADG